MKMTMGPALTVICALLLAGTTLGRQPTPSFRPTHVVDLTHALTSDFPYIPVEGITFPFKLTPIATIEKNGVAGNRWDIHEHIGTQIDAPNHFIAGGASLEA